MRDFLSERVRGIPPSGIRKYFDLVEGMEGAISLGVGEPDFCTPWDVRNAGILSLRKGYTQYTANRGMAELRALISRYLSERFGAEYSPEHIIVTVGASEGIDLSLRAVCDVGDEILLPDPAYVSYAPIVTLCGGTPVCVRCRAEENFVLTPEGVEESVTPKTKAIVLAYPNNPTGGIMTKEQLLALVPVLQKHDLLVISDEIYAELTYGGRHCSVASLPGMRERTVLLGGFSKSFAMTGWRIGFACAPDEIDAAMLKIHQYTMLCVPPLKGASRTDFPRWRICAPSTTDAAAFSWTPSAAWGWTVLNRAERSTRSPRWKRRGFRGKNLQTVSSFRRRWLSSRGAPSGRAGNITSAVLMRRAWRSSPRQWSAFADFSGKFPAMWASELTKRLGRDIIKAGSDGMPWFPHGNHGRLY